MASVMMPRSEQDKIGLDRIAVGAGIGLAAAMLAIVIPVGFLLVAAYDPGGFLSLHQAALLDAIGILLIAGALLFLFSLFVFRRAFSHLRKVEERFWIASILCLIGSIGFLLVLVAAIVIIGSSSSLLSCINNAPTHALSCLNSGEPLGAYTGTIGFWLAWLGGVGIFLGLVFASSRYHVGSIGLGAVFYAILLLALIGPFIALVVSFPGSEFLLLLAPIFSVLAPFFVLHGARPLVV